MWITAQRLTGEGTIGAAGGFSQNYGGGGGGGRVAVYVELEPYVSADEFFLQADEVTYDNCGSAFYRWTFYLPPGSSAASLSGMANVDDQGVLYLNGTPVSGLMHVPDCDPLSSERPFDPSCYGVQDCEEGNQDMFDDNGLQILTWPTRDPFSTCDVSLFVAGENEVVFAVCGDASFWEPTGVEFELMVHYDFPYRRGDMNCDGSIDFDDIAPFVKALAGRAEYYGAYPECNWLNADVNQDDFVTFDDIWPFIASLGS